MRGVVFTGDKMLDFVSFDDPVPGPGEVVLEIKASGLCGSDLKFYRAPKGGGFQALGFKGDSAPVIDSSKDDPVEVIMALTSGLGASKSVDTRRRCGSLRRSALFGGLGRGGTGRRGRAAHGRRQHRDDSQAAHAHRLLDILQRRPARLSAFRGQPQGCG